MEIRTFSHSLGIKGFEINFMTGKFQLRIDCKTIFNFCRFGKQPQELVSKGTGN
jgi:hypothetical protein